MENSVISSISCTYLPHINRNLAALPDDAGSIWPLHPLLEVGQDLRGRDSPESLGSLMAHHLGLVAVLEDLEESGDGVGGEELAEHKRNLVPVGLQLARMAGINRDMGTRA